jgi:hypothetical protein
MYNAHIHDYTFPYAFIAIAVAYMMVCGGASTLAAAPQEK